LRTLNARAFRLRKQGQAKRRPLRKNKGSTSTIPPPISLTYVTRKQPAVTAAIAVAATASATTEVIALDHRLGFVDGQAATFELRAVERPDGALRHLARRHFDKDNVWGSAVAGTRVTGRAANEKLRQSSF